MGGSERGSWMESSRTMKVSTSMGGSERRNWKGIRNNRRE